MRNCLKIVMGIVATIVSLQTVFAQDGMSGERTEVRVETKEVPFSIKYEVSREVAPGTEHVLHPGKKGVVKRTFEVTIFDNKEVGRKQVKEELAVKPEPQVVQRGIGRSRQNDLPYASRGFSRTRVLTMKASAYDTSAASNGGNAGRTASGMRLRPGVVAVDPRVIPLGTTLYIEGYGMAIAGDTGGSIKGNRIDLCMGSRGEVNRFGRRTVTVHVLRANR